MADIGDLIARLGLNTREFDEGAKHAEERMEHLKDFMKEALSTIGVGFSLEKVAEAIKGQIEEVASLGHEAEKLDVGVNSLIALKHEAAMAHVEFESLSGGIQKMQKNLAEAAAGEKKQAEAMASLGIDIEKIINLPADQQFGIIADKIAHMENATDRADAAFKVFGRGGIELMNVLRQGSGGIEQARKEVEKLGLAVNGEEFEKLENADKAMKRLGEAAAGSARIIAAELGPSITKALEGVTNMIQWFDKQKAEQKKEFDQLPDNKKAGHFGIKPGGVADTLAHLFIQDLSERELAEAAKPNPQLQNIIDHLGTATTAAGATRNALNSTGKEGGESLALAAAKAAQLQKELDDLQKDGDKLTDALRTPIEKAEDEWERAQELFDAGAIDEDTFAKAFMKFGTEIQKVRDEQMKPFIEEFEKLTSAADRLYEETRTPQEKWNEDIQQLLDMFDQGIIDEDLFARGWAKANDDRDKALKKGSPKSDSGKTFDNQGLVRGSKEDLEAIVYAMNSQTRDKQTQIAEHTKATAEHTEKQTDLMQMLNDKWGQIGNFDLLS